MAIVTAIGEPVNELEREVLFYLRHNLPDSFEILHNLQIQQDKRSYEIDFVLIAPHGVYVVDIKGTKGFIDIYNNRWCPSDRQSYPSPVSKLHHHAQILKSLIVNANNANTNLKKVYVKEAVILCAEGVQFLDHVGQDEDSITYADKRCLNFFNTPDWQAYFLQDIRSYHGTIRKAILGKAEPKSPLPKLGDWQTEEKLGELELYEEYRAHKILLPNLKVRLRVYGVDPYLNEEERQAQQDLISNAYGPVLQLPSHSNILGIRDFFKTADHDRFIIVVDDISGQSLLRYLGQNLDLEQKYTLIQEILIALDFIHNNQILHRNLTPRNIVVDAGGQPKLTGFDYARVQNRTTTISHHPEVLKALAAEDCYHAPECYDAPSQASPQSDLFSAGIVFYEILTGTCPFDSPDAIFDHKAQFPQPASQVQPEKLANFPADLDDWLQSLCAFEPGDRPTSADAALKTFAQLISQPPPEPEPEPTPEPLDLCHLQPGDTLKQRYQILERLGEPGAFAVAYRVVDSWSGNQKLERVLKLVYRDPTSVYDRLIQEYQALNAIPPHPYIVQCLGADEIPANSSQASIPYIIFEYVAGESIDRWLDKADLTLEQILSLGRQVAEGLAHLHRHGVYHQDIKPNNLFWTETGVKIIDFNIAAFEDENTPPSAGTRRYTPPDLSRTTALNNSDRVHRDLYALGITLYECLTQGCYPFESNAPPRGVQPQDPRSHSSPNPDLTDALVNWLCRVLAPYQADRFPDAATVLTELDRACQPEPAPLPAPEPTVPETSEPRLDPAAMPPPVIAAVSPPARKTPEPAVTVLPPPSIPVLTYDFTPPQCIVLDPTTSYPRPENCQPIASEVDWLQHHPDPHSTPSTLFWIQGVALCEWVRVWLQVWHHNDWIAETKAHPGEILKTYLGDTSPDPTWTIAQQSDLATRLQRYPVPQALSQVLADLSQSPPHLWLDPTNRENLAQWLSLTVPAPWQPLEQAWLAQLPPSPFQPYYATANKQQLLRCWLGLDPDQPVPTDLGIFPGTVPDLLQAEFDQHWYQSINQSLNQPLNQPTPVSTQLSLNLALENLPDRPRIATQAYTVLCHNPQLISRDRIHSLQPYLTPEQATELQDHLAPPCPDPLPPAASTAQALTWATQQYLPFRCWEVNHGIDRVDRRSTRLADGFIDWIVGTYPDLKEIRTADSPLNYKVAAMVDELSQTAAVLWVVIDGLSWLDHQQILEYLTQSRKLQLQEPLTPCFSILPTVTGYAKWSLYSQKLPGDAHWQEDAGRGFPDKKGYKRYTRPNPGKLYKDLRHQKQRVYCWDTVELDEAYHKYSDWRSWHRQERLRILKSLADQIQGLMKEYPDPADLKLVISSDHGQILGTIPNLSYGATDLEHRGRLLVGRVEDDRFVVLEADRFGLPHDLSIVRSDAGLGQISYNNTEGEKLGSHGGLFPEEVVIGYSVLAFNIPRLPLQVHISGSGRADQPGTFSLQVHNPNSLPLDQAHLWIRELPPYSQGYPLNCPIPPKSSITLTLPLESWPSSLASAPHLALTGELRGHLGGKEAIASPLDKGSQLDIEQIFTSVGPSLDDFL